MAFQVLALQETVFKLFPVQSTELDKRLQVPVESGATFDLLAEPELHTDGQHLRLRLPDNSFGYQGPIYWYGFAAHLEVEGTESKNNPQETEPIVQLAEGKMVRLSQSIIPGGNFSWGEATRNGTRLPVSQRIVENIERTAQALQEVREFLGNHPIIVTSWYRPPDVNRAVGGATNSRHLVGDAVDFYTTAGTPQQVYNRLERWWGNRGGLAFGRGFVHIDTRGYAARWRYPGA